MNEKLTRALSLDFHFYLHSGLLSTRGSRLLIATMLFAIWPVAGVAMETEGCAEPGAVLHATEGVTAYVDPDTGELLPGPPPGQAEPPDSASTVPEAPQYETETRTDGTVVLDLSQRPPEVLHAETVDGKTVLCHRQGSLPPEPSNN